MLECYKCCRGYHLTCLNPPLTDPPQVLLSHMHGPCSNACLPHWLLRMSTSICWVSDSVNDNPHIHRRA